MSQFDTFILDAYEDHLLSLAISVNIAGKTLQALPAVNELAPSLDMGGVTDTTDGMIVLRTSDFTIMPKIGTKIIVDNVESRISAIYKQPDAPIFSIQYTGVSER